MPSTAYQRSRTWRMRSGRCSEMACEAALCLGLRRHHPHLAQRRHGLHQRLEPSDWYPSVVRQPGCGDGRSGRHLPSGALREDSRRARSGPADRRQPRARTGRHEAIDLVRGRVGDAARAHQPGPSRARQLTGHGGRVEVAAGDEDAPRARARGDLSWRRARPPRTRRSRCGGAGGGGPKSRDAGDRRAGPFQSRSNSDWLRACSSLDHAAQLLASVRLRRSPRLARKSTAAAAPTMPSWFSVPVSELPRRGASSAGTRRAARPARRAGRAGPTARPRAARRTCRPSRPGSRSRTRRRPAAACAA
mgnify:CR=1 FL=1